MYNKYDYLDWRNWFTENHEEEERYQMFSARFAAESNGEEIEGTPEEMQEKAQRAANEENENNYYVEEHYRESYAKHRGYVFKPKPYDPDKKYKG